MDTASVQVEPAGLGASSTVLEKRKRSPSDPPSAPQKMQRPANAHLAINYLARQFENDLPLISTDDALPSILHLLGDYQGVLDRHESMACNLGARPLGPILIKRFERLFDGPPRVLKNHGKDGNTVTWLDVVEFARNKPEQFVLGQMSEGLRVCQIHLKQSRVQISEEDFMLIKSGMPQNLIPPLPIVEDEEKELGTLEILEKNLSGISHLADQVAARTRQLKHRINGRRNAILERRANEPGPVIRGTSPSVLHDSGLQSLGTNNNANGRPVEYSKTGASLDTKNELLGKFFTQADRERRDFERGIDGSMRYTAAGYNTHRTSTGSVGQFSNGQYRDIHPRELPQNGYNGARADISPEGYMTHMMNHRPALSTNPSTYGDNISVHSFSVPASSATAGVLKEVRAESQDGPFRAEMVARMEGLKKGDRVSPPCDRCRRLHMDCIKNLTACVGCTKKHAKCSWRDVRESELWGPDKGKVPIPAAGGNDERDREPSVGIRPDHASMQLLNALGRHSEQGSPASASDGYPPSTRDPRALAMEGLTATEQQQQQQSNGYGYSKLSRHQSPVDAQPATAADVRQYTDASPKGHHPAYDSHHNQAPDAMDRIA